jgi:hypothetical protein
VVAAATQNFDPEGYKIKITFMTLITTYTY